MTKTCTRCRETKPLDAFARKAARKDGRASWCRSCAAANYQNSKARYDIVNKRAYSVRMADPEQRESARIRSASNRLNKPDQLRRAVADWKRRNPEQRNAHERTRRARIAACEGRHDASDIARLLRAQNGKCAYCAEALERYHVDHKTPLARGGSNAPFNLALACPPCNLRKGTLTADEFTRRAA